MSVLIKFFLACVLLKKFLVRNEWLDAFSEVLKPLGSKKAIFVFVIWMAVECTSLEMTMETGKESEGSFSNTMLNTVLSSLVFQMFAKKSKENLFSICIFSFVLIKAWKAGRI